MNKTKLYINGIKKFLLTQLSALLKAFVAMYIFYILGRGILNTETVIEKLTIEGNTTYSTYIIFIIMLAIFTLLVKLIKICISYLNTITNLKFALLRAVNSILFTLLLIYLINAFYITSSSDIMYMKSYGGAMFDLTIVEDGLYFVINVMNFLVNCIFILILIGAITSLISLIICMIKIKNYNVNFKEVLLTKYNVCQISNDSVVKYNIYDSNISLEEALAKAFLENGDINIYLNKEMQTVTGISVKDEETIYSLPNNEVEEKLYYLYTIKNDKIRKAFDKKLIMYKKGEDQFFISTGLFRFSLVWAIKFIVKAYIAAWDVMRTKKVNSVE